MAYTAGDDWRIVVRLKDGEGNPLTLSEEDKAYAAVSDLQTMRIYCGPKEVRRDAVGANWDEGVLVVEFSASETVQVEPSPNLYLEIQVEREGFRQTFAFPIEVRKSPLARARVNQT